MALQLNWGFINTQQLITFTSLFGFAMPSALYYFFQLTQGAYKFSFFSTYEVTKLIFGVQEDTYNFYSPNFGEFGFQNHLFILNMDVALYFFLVYPVILVLIGVLGIFGRFSVL